MSWYMIWLDQFPLSSEAWHLLYITEMKMKILLETVCIRLSIYANIHFYYFLFYICTGSNGFSFDVNAFFFIIGGHLFSVFCWSVFNENNETGNQSRLCISWLIGATKKGPRGCPGTPNKEQNGANKEQNRGNKDQNRAFLGVVFHENTSCKSKFRSKGAELFWAPPIL